MGLKFSKYERLASKKIIERLFKYENKIYLNSFTLLWSTSDNSNCRVEILFSVPKKKVIKAVNRTHIKRIMRECYRTNKDYIYGILNSNIYVALIYNTSEIMKYAHLERELLEIFDVLGKKINESI